MYRFTGVDVEVFLVHPGGPYFARKDAGFWSFPKGEIDDAGQSALEVACREFEEETGQTVGACGAVGEFLPLDHVRQRGGKVVHAWAFEGRWPSGAVLRSNTCPVEWPPRSGRRIEVPEVDVGRFFSIEEARRRINPAQVELIDRLLRHLER